jgi:DNA invertase Pin-like site-specific DNA recombinase
MKRVWCLYRVSTKGQVSADEDIPMQKNACHNFVSTHKDWEITNELYERGVSGWKKKADERDALNDIREAAVNREFDVLLVFMFDRLGRRDDETPFVINFLIENAVEVWSVNEGQRKIEQHVDKLINYISSWQSSVKVLKLPCVCVNQKNN